MVMNSDFWLEHFLVGRGPVSFFVGKPARVCKGASDHQGTDIGFPVASAGLTGSNTTSLKPKNFN